MCNFNILPPTGLFIFAIFVVCWGSVFVSAQVVWDNEKEIPPWMEKVDRGGGSTYLIPKGAKIKEVTAGFVKIEPPAEYVARQVYEMDKRQAALEKELKEIKSELAELREQCALQQQSSSEKAP
jgi:hypothetical protein